MMAAGEELDGKETEEVRRCRSTTQLRFKPPKGFPSFAFAHAVCS